MSAEEKITRYELARQGVATLTRKHKELILKCECLDTTEDLHGLTVEFGMPCGAAAYKISEESKDRSTDNIFGYISFEDAFFNWINDEHGACETCAEAYSIKWGELAKAKKEFGNAKRSLSYLGKKLIKQIGDR